jgi:hypothetical protein
MTALGKEDQPAVEHWGRAQQQIRDRLKRLVQLPRE